MQGKSGSIFGGMLLIGGSCIGAGMLGLPIITGLCGFKLSLLIFLLSWAFMTLTGLLLVEIQGWFPKDVNLITMVDGSLGSWFKKASWLLYLFLFYSLLVAYIAGIGMLTSSISGIVITTIPSWLCSIIWVAIISLLLLLNLKTIDLCNRVFMFGKICSYLAIIITGVFYIRPSLLEQNDLNYIFFSLPIMVIAFGFHNLIPTITKYMGGDPKRVKLAIVLGSFLALIIYVIWDFIVLGIVPKEGEYGLVNSLKQGRDASQAIAGILNNGSITWYAKGLAFFSFLTSLLIQSLALTHFLDDGFKNRFNLPWLILIAVLPPLMFAIYDPTIFFKALDFAGGICAVILFGIFPVLTVWHGRYRKNLISSYYTLIGGKIVLVAIFTFACFIILFQLKMMVL